jgi:predicted nucleic-acid-binding Zn-ribbon protein
MKCAACKYEHLYKYEESSGRPIRKVTKGDDSFISIQGNFTQLKKRDYGPDYLEEVSIVACPKCGTTRIGMYGDNLPDEEDESME